MSIMGAIFSKVFDESGIGTSTVSCGGGAVHDAAFGQNTFPQPVDIEAALGRIATKKRETLHWRTSMVDLLKLLNLESDLDTRRQLAHELGYGGNVEDSATMNMWLHREVMRKLAHGDHKVLDAARD